MRTLSMRRKRSVPQGTERATAGIADATSFGDDDAPQAIIDWKSDVDPRPRPSSTIGHRFKAT